MAGTAYDDGSPVGSSLAYEWEVVSGDSAAVTFANRNAAETTATIAVKGFYVFRLKVTDGARVVYGDPVMVEVAASGTSISLR